MNSNLQQGAIMNSTNDQLNTSPAIDGNNVLCHVVLDVLYEWHRKQSGWWYGYTKLMIDVRKWLADLDIVETVTVLKPKKNAKTESEPKKVVRYRFKEKNKIL